MTDAKQPLLEAAVPILSVSDLPQALDYYTRVLGFGVSWQWREPPHLASVCRDRVELNLSQSADNNAGVSRVYFQMSEVEQCYSQLVASGARVAISIADRPYGMRDFRILDPSGNELSFGEAIGS